MDKNKARFGKNEADKLSRISGISTGLIPVFGPILNEIVSDLLPNQRMDRVCKYLEALVKVIPEERMEKFKDMPEKLQILEEGMLSSAFVTDEEKRERIIKAVAYGLNTDELDKDSFQLLMRLLKSLGTAEFIILNSYSHKPEKRLIYKKRHPSIFPDFPAHPMLDVESALPEEEYQNEYQRCQNLADRVKSYEQHLSSLGLLRITRTAFQKKNTTNYAITLLGKDLLASITGPDEGGPAGNE